MQHPFSTIEHLHELWDGPPGPRPRPTSAFSGWDEIDLLGKERVQGDPRGPGGPPHNLCRIPVSEKVCGITHPRMSRTPPEASPLPSLLLLSGPEWEHSCVQRRHSCRR